MEDIDQRFKDMQKQIDDLTKKLSLANSRLTFIMKQQRFWPGKGHRVKGPLSRNG